LQPRQGLALWVILLLWAPPARAAGGSESPLTDWLAGLGDAAQALADGRTAASVAAARRALAARPHGTAGTRASAALGLALAAHGQPADAALALEVALAGPPVPARAHLAFARGQALLEAGRPAEAAGELARAALAERLALASRARLLEAAALREAGLVPEAVRALEPLAPALAPGEQPGPTTRAALLQLAHARRAAGDSGAAVEAYRVLWLAAPASPEGRDAGAALAAWREAGGPVASPLPEEHLARALRLCEEGWPDEALEELERAGPEPGGPGGGADADALRAVALLAAGRHSEAEAVAAELLAAGPAGASAPSGPEGTGTLETPGPGALRSAAWVLARTAARAGRLEDAVGHLRAVAAARAPVAGLPESRQRELGDEAAYLAAWLPYDAGQFARAAEALHAFARANPRSRRAEDALWFSAWALHRLGREAEAVRAFGRLVPGPLADGALYWQARLGPRGRRPGLYRSAAALGGNGWYGLLARARLRELGLPAPGPGPVPSRPIPDEPAPPAAARLAVAAELYGLGLEGAAREELDALARGAAARAAAPHLAQLAVFAGDAELPFRMARDHLLPTRRALRWSHPVAHPEHLLPSARGFGVDPALLLAVMRRESGFREAARSAAGAEGLLQLRPATAARAATVLGVPGPSSLALPASNVPVGAHYLGLLLSRFGSPAVAVAAYNAGPRAAAGWALTGAGLPLDAWVETIGYRETRQYVRIVLAEWDVYRRLAGEPPAPIDPGEAVKAPGDGVAF
jgi:soluble lytic murein transglycosylase